MPSKVLKRCPFCGKAPEPYVKTIHGGYCFIHRCPVIGPVTLEGDEEYVVKKWNTRINPSTGRRKST